MMKRHKIVQLKQAIEVQVISYGQIREERGRFEAGQRCELLDKLHGAVCLRVGCHVFWTNLHLIQEVAVKRASAPTKAKPARKVQDNAIGQIYVASWGYDQTNVDAYQVVRATEKTLYLQPIATEQVRGTEGFMCCNVRPVQDHFIRGFGKAPRIRRMGKHLFPESAYGKRRLYKLWDGKETFYNSWYA